MQSRGDREVLCRRENLKRPRRTQDSVSAHSRPMRRRVSLVSAAIIHARLVGERCNKRDPAIYASAGSCIAPRRGRGIRLIILIVPSTPFLCARQASTSSPPLARALPSRARFNFMPLAAICTYN